MRGESEEADGKEEQKATQAKTGNEEETVSESENGEGKAESKPDDVKPLRYESVHRPDFNSPLFYWILSLLSLFYQVFDFQLLSSFVLR